MKKQVFISVLIVVFFNFIIGCSEIRMVKISPQEFSYGYDNIESLVLLDSSVVKFNKDGGQYPSEKSKITGLLLDSTFVSVDPANVQSLNVSKFDIYNAAGNDLMAIGGVLVVSILIIWAALLIGGGLHLSSGPMF